MADQTTDLQGQISINPSINISDSGPCKKKISIEISENDIRSNLESQFKNLRKMAQVPGFRVGRAPLRLVEKRFGKEVNQQLKLRLIAEAAEKAIKDNKLDTLGEPDINHENIQLPAGGPMNFEFEVEVKPQFELPELEGIAVERPILEVTDAQIEQELDNLRRDFGTWEVKQGSVLEDDQIIADIKLTYQDAEGKQQQQTVENSEVFIRSGTCFAGHVPVENLAELFKGATVGDTRETSTDVPNTFFNETYRGKKVDVSITVKEIKTLKPAEMNEEFFRRFGMSDATELKNVLRERTESHILQQQRTAMADTIYNYLLKNTTFDLPASLVAQQGLVLLQRQYTRLLLRGVPKEEISKQMEQLRSAGETQAAAQLKLLFIIDKLAEKLGVQVEPEEINGHIAQVAIQRNMRPEKLREQMAKDGSLSQFIMELRASKCVDKILETAKITDVRLEDKTDKKETSEQDSAHPGKKTGETRKKTAAKRTKKKESDE